VRNEKCCGVYVGAGTFRKALPRRSVGAM